MSEGFDLFGELPAELRCHIITYLAPLSFTVSLARCVCKQWAKYIPAPPVQTSGEVFRRLLYKETMGLVGSTVNALSGGVPRMLAGRAGSWDVAMV